MPWLKGALKNPLLHCSNEDEDLLVGYSKVHPWIAWYFHSTFPKCLGGSKLGVQSPLNQKLPNQCIPEGIIPSFAHLDRESLRSLEFLRAMGKINQAKPECLPQALHWHPQAGSALSYTSRAWPQLHSQTGFIFI